MTEAPDAPAAEPEPPPRPGRWLAGALLVALYLGAWLLLTPEPGLPWYYGVSQMVFGVVLLVTGIPSLIYVARTRRLDGGGFAAIAAVLAVPVVVLLVLTGVCVSIGR